MRQILVFDIDRAFVSLLQNILNIYGFEIQAKEPELENIKVINSVKPEAVFIAFDKSDRMGYTLCSEVRKRIGKEIPIVLVAASLSPEDLTLYRKLNLDADLYLDKRVLTRKELLEKLDELIGLGKPISPPLSSDDKSHPESEEDEQMTFREDKSGLLKDSHGRANDELQQRLAGQEKEISRLRQQLDELVYAINPASSSNNLKTEGEQKNQEDLEVSKLSEKLDNSNRELLTGKKKLKELTEQISQLEEEIEQGLERTKELTSIFKVKQKVNSELKKPTEVLTDERQELQEAPRPDENRVVQQEVDIEDMEKQYHDQLGAVDEKRKTELIQEKENSKHVLENFKDKYAVQMSHLQSEKDAEIEALNEKVNEEAQKAADMMNQERQAHEKSLKEYEAKITQLEAHIKEAEKEYLTQLHIADEKRKKELLKSEDYHNNIVNSIVRRYDAQIAELRAEMVKEHQAHMETRKEYEAKIARLLEQHSDAYKKAELRHASRLAELQSERDSALEALKKKLMEEGGMSFDSLKKEDE